MVQQPLLSPNLYWEKDGFCFRTSIYLMKLQIGISGHPGTGGQFSIILCRLSIGLLSTPEAKTGLRIVSIDKNGNKKKSY